MLRTTAMFPKAYRWIAEIQQIEQFRGGPRNGSEIHEGAARMYEQISAQWEKEGVEGASFIAAKSFLGDYLAISRVRSIFRRD